MIVTGIVFNLYHLASAKSKIEEQRTLVEKIEAIWGELQKGDALRPNRTVCIEIIL